MIQVNDRVKPSEYALRSKRDYWLQCGRYDQKQRAKEALDREQDKRGIVTEITEHNGIKGLVVKWLDGTVSHCLPYRVEKTQD